MSSHHQQSIRRCSSGEGGDKNPKNSSDTASKSGTHTQPTVPKGFGHFYGSFPRQSDTNVERSQQSFEPSERTFQEFQETKVRSNRRAMMIMVTGSIAMLYVGYKTMRQIQLSTSAEQQAMDETTQVLVDLDSHTATFCDEKNTQLFSKRFIDYHAFEHDVQAASAQRAVKAKEGASAVPPPSPDEIASSATATDKKPEDNKTADEKKETGIVDKATQGAASLASAISKAMSPNDPRPIDIRILVPVFFPLSAIAFLWILPLLARFHRGLTTGMATARSEIQNSAMKEKSRFRFKKEHSLKTRLDDVAGLTEAKGEIIEIIDFLKTPARYTDLGAKLPKGVLLDGPPGVGKTLLAKAVAGEAMVPFVSCSGSEFEEVYVGVGAMRVRELFKEARKSAPCVVFIDEIDTFGKKRRSDSRGNSRGTINAVLSELDGFKSSENIIVLAATNRADVLDSALTRSGRFDRKISLEKPPHKDRVAIAKVHLRPLKLDPSLDVEKAAESIASLTPGCSGADIYNICNESAITASRENLPHVTMKCFHVALDRILVGMAKKATKLADHERERLAYHEAGHVILSWFQKSTDPVMKATIVPRGGSSGGKTRKLPLDRYISTQEMIRQKMISHLGGYVSEERFFHDVSSSAAEDLQQVTNMVRDEVTIYGMEPDTIGHFGFQQDENAITKPYGPHKEDAIDSAVRKITEEVTKSARDLLKQYENQVRVVAGMLLKQEAVTARELWLVLGERPHMTPEFRKYLESEHV